jgi:hypothetical protein
MVMRLRRELFSIVLPMALATGCVEGNLADGAKPRGTGSAGSDSGSSAGTGSGADGGAGSQAGASTGDPSSPLLPARIRRLTNAEYENSARAVVGNTDAVTSDFAPDARQSGYTVNDEQRVDSVLVKQISSAASKLAAVVRTKVDTLAKCDNQATGAEACAIAFIQSFATHAYRRPLADDEVDKLVALFHVGADGGTYADGIELVATGVLQSAGFLYLTETGDKAAGAEITLTPHETASAISYLITAGPPDAELVAAAESGELETGEQRSAAFTRLVSGADTSASRARVLRVIQEWLGTDRLTDTAKDSTVYGGFTNLKQPMLEETGAFLQRLVERKTGTVGELLGANWTVTSNQGLIAQYGGNMGGDEVTLPERRGILNQGAFLSVYAHASETGPVLRGVTVLRRIACYDVKSPASIMLTVPPLQPDPTKTMRERLKVHTADPMCGSCHNAIDAVGFSFEQYDGMGNKNVKDGVTVDNSGRAIDSRTTTALAGSAAVLECFARNIFRASAGRSSGDVKAAETAFVEYWKKAPAPAPDANHPTPAAAAEGSILEALRAVVTSPNFTHRRAQ